jgi:hypothetical protein
MGTMLAGGQYLPKSSPFKHEQNQLGVRNFSRLRSGPLSTPKAACAVRVLDFHLQPRSIEQLEPDRGVEKTVPATHWEATSQTREVAHPAFVLTQNSEVGTDKNKPVKNEPDVSGVPAQGAFEGSNVFEHRTNPALRIARGMHKHVLQFGLKTLDWLGTGTLSPLVSDRPMYPTAQSPRSQIGQIRYYQLV